MGAFVFVAVEILLQHFLAVRFWQSEVLKSSHANSGLFGKLL